MNLLLQATFMNFPGLCVFVAHFTCHGNGYACLTPESGTSAASDHAWWFGSIRLWPSCMPAYTHTFFFSAFNPWGADASWIIYHTEISNDIMSSIDSTNVFCRHHHCVGVIWRHWIYLMNVGLMFEFFNWFKFGKIPPKHLDAIRCYYKVRYMELHSCWMRDCF